MTREARYSSRLDDALAFAAAAFRDRRRKGTDIPYLTHLLQVMVYVGEHGGDEEQMVAAVLHDYLEDIEGATSQELRERFGERVARLVEGLSDCTTQPKPPWEQRKRDYLEKLRTAAPELKLISAADKLHNAQSVRRDLMRMGEGIFGRFSASREQTLWYYRAVTRALEEGFEHALVAELREEVERLHAAAGASMEGD